LKITGGWALLSRPVHRLCWAICPGPPINL
jgi:hypothetical protein